MTEEKPVEEKVEPSIDYFPGASHEGKIFNVSGILWLVQEHVKVITEDKEEYG